jgi:hypothetical protein
MSSRRCWPGPRSAIAEWGSGTGGQKLATAPPRSDLHLPAGISGSGPQDRGQSAVDRYEAGVVDRGLSAGDRADLTAQQSRSGAGELFPYGHGFGY